MSPTVAVLGGGVGGLCAAHHLARRGIDVRVYEREPRFGGKARSFPSDEGGSGPPLPGEHGFRFFPGFYQHLPATLREIPYGDGTVADQLVSTRRMLRASIDGGVESVQTETPTTIAGWRELMESLFVRDRVPQSESRFFVERLLVLMTSCERRRIEEYDDVSWWSFIGAEERSEAYQRYLGYGITQSLVAMRPQESSARTIGRIYIQLFTGMFDPEVDADRLLAGPSNEIWIDPWVDYLAERGVEFHPATTVDRIESDGRRVTGVAVSGPDGERTVTADQYVAAVPVEVMERLVDRSPALERAAPSLSGVRRLDTAWMAGVQFYLTEDRPLGEGHGIFHDSPWALTTISQRQFWPEFDFDARSDDVDGIISVCVSDWESPGIRYGKPAKECTREEVIEEVWTQLNAHLEQDGGAPLEDEIRHAAFLDPAIVETDDGLRNESPLLINTTGSLKHRPPADTAAPNLVIASDYVRTNTDLASMESADEAARRAAAAIIDREGLRVEPPTVWDLSEPAFFEPMKLQDRTQHRLGLPHPGEVTRSLRRSIRSVLPGTPPASGSASPARSQQR